MRAETIALSNNVEKYFWYDLVNDQTDPAQHEGNFGLVKQAIADEQLIAMRHELAEFAGKTFAQVGDEMLAVGSIFGGDRVAGKSPFGHGSDEIVAISMLLRIGSQLTTASADLFRDGRQYAAAALLRQLVEIEYLAWAFQRMHLICFQLKTKF